MNETLILSRDLDEETSGVMAWLDSYEHAGVKRINTFNQSTTYSFSLDEEISNFSKIWVRKSANTDKITSLGEHNNTALNAQINSEKDAIINHIIYSFPKSKALGKSSFNDNEKLINLSIAKSIGMNVPDTIITTKKKELTSFAKRHNFNLISKAISNSIFLTSANKNYGTYTEAISRSLIRTLPETFFPSLFQERIIKTYEIRVFFLKNKLFSTAIFSQNHNDSENDFRKNQLKTNLRYSPVTLSKKTTSQIIKLMNKTEVNIGSVDLMVDKQGVIYFLEVNPFGQFKKFSDTCNFYLEKEVADSLLTM